MDLHNGLDKVYNLRPTDLHCYYYYYYLLTTDGRPAERNNDETPH